MSGADRLRIRMLSNSASPYGTFPAGSVVGPGDAPEEFRRDLCRKGYAVSLDKSPPVERAVAPQPDKETQDARPDWPLKSSPEWYLKRYPDGPKADLARQLVES